MGSRQNGEPAPEAKKRRITVLFNTDGPPPANQDYAAALSSGESRAEYDVARALASLGHEVSLLGFFDDLETILRGLKERNPELVFNLAEAFVRDSSKDAHVTALLELLGLRYTGSPPAALALAGDKGQSKKVLAFHGVRVPEFRVYRRGEPVVRPSVMRFPLIVKPLSEDGSFAISQDSVVEDDARLQERVAFIHERHRMDAIVEELVEGRELYVGVLGSDSEPAVLPVVEMEFRKLADNNEPIATWKAKWDREYRKRHGIRNVVAKKIPEEPLVQIQEAARTAYRALGLRDYARVDVRLAPDGAVYVIELNPNPYIAAKEDFPMAAEAAGLPYPMLVQRILDLALAR